MSDMFVDIVKVFIL